MPITTIVAGCGTEARGLHPYFVDFLRLSEFHYNFLDLAVSGMKANVVDKVKAMYVLSQVIVNIV